MGWLDLSTKGEVANTNESRRKDVDTFYKGLWFTKMHGFMMKLMIEWDVEIPYLTSILVCLWRSMPTWICTIRYYFQAFEMTFSCGMAASFVARECKIVPFEGASAFIFPPTKLRNDRTRKLWNDLLILSPILCLQVWSWSPFATSMILSIWIWIENVYKEWENRSRCRGLCEKCVVKMCLFLVFFWGGSRYHKTNLAGIMIFGGFIWRFVNLWEIAIRTTSLQPISGNLQELV